ncbi:MAG: UDP-N-acetylmuramoyl-L-alanine--D-glutamate ligase [Deltaproteobacteria bacterium]|nr:UDP-N-acetylmuramoyl-L-alanine--D-glutamate ligase [Deltaproteobacteria bacterium]
MDLKGKRVLVVGLGRSGLSAARLLRGRGARVFATDQAAAEKIGPRAASIEPLVEEMSLGGFREDWFDACDLVVVSPGVPLSLPVFDRARRADVPIVSEIELASWLIDIPLLAITGTNGKSTTTALCGAMLESSGRRAFVGGNIGVPLSDLAASDEPYDVACVELSSFQLEATDAFHPRAAAVTNIAPNHQDRYVDFATYARAKRNIFKQMDASDTAVLNANCAGTAKHLSGLPCPIRWFGDEELGGAFVADGALVVRDDAGERRFALDAFRLPGTHNLDNLMAASLVAFAGGATTKGFAAPSGNSPGCPTVWKRSATCAASDS